MAITPVSASNGTVTATQALRPQQEAYGVQRTAREAKSYENANETVAPQAPVLKPTVNTNGQTVGTIVNITA